MLVTRGRCNAREYPRVTASISLIYIFMNYVYTYNAKYSTYLHRYKVLFRSDGAAILLVHQFFITNVSVIRTNILYNHYLKYLLTNKRFYLSCFNAKTRRQRRVDVTPEMKWKWRKMERYVVILSIYGYPYLIIEMYPKVLKTKKNFGRPKPMNSDTSAKHFVYTVSVHWPLVASGVGTWQICPATCLTSTLLVTAIDFKY